MYVHFMLIIICDVDFVACYTDQATVTRTMDYIICCNPLFVHYNFNTVSTIRGVNLEAIGATSYLGASVQMRIIMGEKLY